MFNHNQLRTQIIQPALDLITLYSQEAEELLVAICAHESLGGTYLKQNGGPALGIYQMEPKSHDNIWNTVMVRNPALRLKLMRALNIPINPVASRMVWDLYYATFMARSFFLPFSEPLPDANNIEAIWEYYKMYWNTTLGDATQSDFIKHYNKFVGKKGV